MGDEPADVGGVGANDHLAPKSGTPKDKMRSALRSRLRWWVLLGVSIGYLVHATAILVDPIVLSVTSHLIALAILLVLFHVLFIWIFPFTARDWKAVDYIWLAFAALGIIGVVGESRRIQSSWAQMDARLRSQSWFELLKEDADSQISYFCMNQWQPPPGDTLIDPVERDFPRTCTWFRQLAAALPDSLGTELPENLAPGVPAPPTVEDPTARADVSEALTMMAAYRRERERYQSAIRALEDDGLEVTFKLTGGTLLVFAIALRITKVTGEILLSPPSEPLTS